MTDGDIAIGLDVDTSQIDSLITRIDKLNSVLGKSGTIAQQSGAKIRKTDASITPLRRKLSTMLPKIGNTATRSLSAASLGGFGGGGLGAGSLSSLIAPLAGLSPLLGVFGAAVTVAAGAASILAGTVTGAEKSLAELSKTAKSLADERDSYDPATASAYQRWRYGQIHARNYAVNSAARYDNAMRSEDLARFAASVSLTESLLGDFGDSCRTQTDSMITLKSAVITATEAFGVVLRYIGSVIVDFGAAVTPLIYVFADVADFLGSIVAKFDAFDRLMQLSVQRLLDIISSIPIIGDAAKRISEAASGTAAAINAVIGNEHHTRKTLDNIGRTYADVSGLLSDSAGFASESLKTLGKSTPQLRGMWDIGTSGLPYISDYQHAPLLSAPVAAGALSNYIPQQNTAQNNVNLKMDVKIDAKYLDEQLADVLVDRIDRELTSRLRYGI